MLTIDRLHIDLRATAAPSRGEGLKRRVALAVPAGIAKAIGGVDDARDPALRFIDRLQVDCAVAADGDDDALVAAVAHAFLAAYGRALATQRGRVFADEADHLAQFWIALADGIAARHWWFDERLDGLRHLPVSAALRTSLIDEGEGAPRILARLTEATARRVLAGLGDADARRVHAHWRTLPPGAPPAWPDVATALPAGAATLDERLVAVVALCRPAAVTPGAAMRAVDQWEACRAIAPEVRAARPGASAAEVWRAVLAALASPAPAWADLDEPSCERVLAHLLPARAQRGPDAGAADLADTADAAFTAHGGVLLLLKALGWVAGWASGGGGTGGVATHDIDARDRRWLAFAIAARALAGRRARAVWRDATLRRALALEADALPDRAQRRRLRALLHASGHARVDAAASATLAALADRIPGLRGSSPGYLRAQVLSAPAWLHAATADSAELTLGPSPLDTLLTLAGLTRGTIELPGRRLRYREARR